MKDCWSAVTMMMIPFLFVLLSSPVLGQVRIMLIEAVSLLIITVFLFALCGIATLFPYQAKKKGSVSEFNL